jgi:hypothetical protein
MHCQVLPPQAWDKKALEEASGITLPLAIIHLWDKASGLRLFEDVNYGQWGLILWSANQVITDQEKRIAQTYTRSTLSLRSIERSLVHLAIVCARPYLPKSTISRMAKKWDVSNPIGRGGFLQQNANLLWVNRAAGKL